MKFEAKFLGYIASIILKTRPPELRGMIILQLSVAVYTLIV